MGVGMVFLGLLFDFYCKMILLFRNQSRLNLLLRLHLLPIHRINTHRLFKHPSLSIKKILSALFRAVYFNSDVPAFSLILFLSERAYKCIRRTLNCFVLKSMKIYEILKIRNFNIFFKFQ